MMNDSINTNELAHLLGLSPPTVRVLQKDGVIAKLGRSFPLVETVRAYVAHLRSLSVKQAPPPPAWTPGEPFVFETVQLDDGTWVFTDVHGVSLHAWLAKQKHIAPR